MRHPFAVSCLAATAALIVACVPPLPGSSLGESGESPDGSSAAAGGMGGAPGSVVMAPDASVAGTVGTGTGGIGDASVPPPDEFTLVADAGIPALLAVNANHLCWVDNDRHALMTMAVNDGSGPMQAVPSVMNLLGLTIDADNVYWASTSGGTVVLSTLPLAGGPPVMLVTDPGLLNFAVNDAGVYWLTAGGAGGPTLMKIDRAGGQPTVLTHAQPVNGLAVDDQSVYWFSYGAVGCEPNCAFINREDVAGGAPTELAQLSTSGAGLTVDSTYLYWLVSPGTIMRVGVNGGTPDLAFSHPFPIQSFAVDASGLYWTDPSGTVYTGTPGGTSLRVVVPGNAGRMYARGIALNANNVYWIAGNSIYRAPK